MLNRSTTIGRDLIGGSQLPRSKQKKNRKATIILLLTTALLSGLLAWRTQWQSFIKFLTEPEEYRFVNPLSEEKNLNEWLGADVTLTTQEDFTKLIQDQVSGLQGRYGIYFKDLENGTAINLRGDELFDAASVVKIVPMVLYYQQVEKNKRSLDDEYILQSGDIQDYGSGSMRYDSAGTRYTFRQLLDLAGKQSDNTADYVLRQNLTEKAINQFLSAENMIQTNIDRVQSTPHEIADFFVKIYEGRLLNQKYRNMFYGNLTDTVFEDRIKAGIPAEVRVIHKIGNGQNRAYNDCGIILSPRPFVLCILNQDASESEAAAAIPKIARIAFEWSIKEDR